MEKDAKDCIVIKCRTLKNLGALYRRQGMYEAAETLEDCALRSKKEALDLVKQPKVGKFAGGGGTPHNDKRRSRHIRGPSGEAADGGDEQSRHPSHH